MALFVVGCLLLVHKDCHIFVVEGSFFTMLVVFPRSDDEDYLTKKSNEEGGEQMISLRLSFMRETLILKRLL